MGERSLRVLVVEDEPTTALLVAEHVGRLPGFEVVGRAGSLEAAARALAPRGGASSGAGRGVDVLLLDMNLPDGHGLDLMRRLRASGWGGDVVALTAATDAAVVRGAVSLGVVQYLVKPFGLDELAERLHAVRRTAARLAGPGPLAGQEEVDAVLRGGRDAAPAVLPKGLGEETLQQVAALLAAAPGQGRSASEVAERIGVSRVTARRYLEHLDRTGRARRRPRHGGRGRPEQEYVWAE